MCKRILGFTLCVGLLLGMLAACGGDAPGSAQGPGRTSGPPQQEEAPGQAGRYIELDITPPKAVGNAVDLVVQGNNIHLLTLTPVAGSIMGDYVLHTSRDGGQSWESEPQDWLDAWYVDTREWVDGKLTGEHSYIQEIFIVPGGGMVVQISYYIHGVGQGEDVCLVRDAKGNVGELSLATMQLAQGWQQDAVATVGRTRPVAEGKIVTSVYTQVYDDERDFYTTVEDAPVYQGLYSLETGELLEELPDWWEVHIAEDGFVLQTGDGLVAYDFDGQEKGALPAQLGGYIYGVFGQSGTYYYTSPGGLMCQRPGKAPEALMSTVGTFSSPLYGMVRMAIPQEGEVLAAYSASQGGPKLKRYVYDENADTLGTLSVFSLQDSDTLRQAIYLFGIDNPGMEVELEVLYDKYGKQLDPESPLNQADVVRELNLRLLAGTGPDVLIMDGLPLDSFIAQDALLDLRGVAADLGLAGQVVDPLYTADGSLYTIPARFSVPMVALQEVEAEGINTLDALPQVTFANPEDVVNALLDTSLPALHSGAALDEAGLTKLLEAAAATVEHGGLMKEGVAVYSERNAFEGGKGYCHSLARMMTGEVTAAYIPFTSFEYLADIAAGARQDYDGVPAAGELALVHLPGLSKGTYSPLLLAGVYSQTGQEALAKELVAALLSKDAQQWEFYDGLPVQKESLAQSLEYHLLNAQNLYGPMELVPFELDTFLNGLATPVLPDDVLRTTVVERAKEYFAGELTLDEAVDAILEDTELYFAER